jgi:predicted nucleic acid-binding protein
VVELPKSLVVDANILFSFFNKSSARRKIMLDVLNNGCRLQSPDFVIDELSKNKERILKFSRISGSAFDEMLAELHSAIETVPSVEYIGFLCKARDLSPHAKDDAYFALALFSNNPIWSDEVEFKKQKSVIVFTTNELFSMLASIRA